MKRLIGEYDIISSSPLADDGLLQTSASHNQPTSKRLETIMSFGHQSEVHKHLFAKRPLFSHTMVEDNAHTIIVEPTQDERFRFRELPTKNEEPTSTHSSS